MIILLELVPYFRLVFKCTNYGEFNRALRQWIQQLFISLGHPLENTPAVKCHILWYSSHCWLQIMTKLHVTNEQGKSELYLINCSSCHYYKIGFRTECWRERLLQTMQVIHSIELHHRVSCHCVFFCREKHSRTTIGTWMYRILLPPIIRALHMHQQKEGGIKHANKIETKHLQACIGQWKRTWKLGFGL